MLAIELENEELDSQQNVQSRIKENLSRISALARAKLNTYISLGSAHVSKYAVNQQMRWHVWTVINQQLAEPASIYY